MKPTTTTMPSSSSQRNLLKRSSLFVQVLFLLSVCLLIFEDFRTNLFSISNYYSDVGGGVAFIQSDYDDAKDENNDNNHNVMNNKQITDQIRLIEQEINRSCNEIETENDGSVSGPGSWWLEDIDELRSKYCGVTKCAYHSKSVPTRGYLIKKQTKGKKIRKRSTQSSLFQYQLVWDVAERFVTKFGIRHLYGPEPPLAVNCTQAGAKKLNYCCIPGHEIFGEIVIQPIIFVPDEPRLNDKIYYSKKKLAKFQELLNNKTYTTTSTGINISIEKYEKQLYDDFNATKQMMDSPEGNGLYSDCQVLFDVFEGHIYQFDLDRGGLFNETNSTEKNFPSNSKSCLTGMKRRITMLVEWKKKQSETTLSAEAAAAGSATVAAASAAASTQ